MHFGWIGVGFRDMLEDKALLLVCTFVSGQLEQCSGGERLPCRQVCMFCGYGLLDVILVVVEFVQHHMWIAFGWISALLIDAVEKSTEHGKLCMWVYGRGARLLLLHKNRADEELSQVLFLIVL
jgi:hypothetical protein